MNKQKKYIVVKCGGTSLQTDLITKLAQNILQLQKHMYDVVLVHGGGKELSELCKQLQLESFFVGGLRHTSPEVLKASQMSLLGVANPSLVAILQQSGVQAVGLSGHSCNLLQGDFLDKDRFGHVGIIKKVNVSFLKDLLGLSYIPVLAPIAVRSDGSSLNVNADSAAASVAAALEAEHLFLFSDVDGYYSRFPDRASQVKEINKNQLQTLLVQASLQGGMRPKLQAAHDALAGGCKSVSILDMEWSGELVDMLLHGVEHGTRIE